MNHVALCKAMGVNYFELMSDDMPGYVVQDWIDVLNAEANASPDATPSAKDVLTQWKRGQA